MNLLQPEQYNLEGAARVLLSQFGEADWVLIESQYGIFAVEPRPDPKNGTIMQLNVKDDGSGNLFWKEAGLGYPLQEYDMLMKKIFLTGSL
jgi:hypothetical protein